MTIHKTANFLLSALGLAGFAGEAKANLVTVPLNFDIGNDLHSFTQDISIDSSTPNFQYYDEITGDPKQTGSGFAQVWFGPINSGLINLGNGYPNFGSPTADPNLAYTFFKGGTLVNVDVKNDPSVHGTNRTGDFYINLAFTNNAGHEEYGYATFDSLGVLNSITYQPYVAPVATPEPPAWLLLIAGAGMTGALASRRRRRAMAT